MKKWKTFAAKGSYLVLEEELNRIEESGWTIFAITGPTEFTEPCRGSDFTNIFWTIAAYKLPAPEKAANENL